MSKRDEMLGAMVIFLFGAVTVFFSLKMSLGTFRTAGSGLFPFSLGILLMVLSSMFLLQVYAKHWPKPERKAGSLVVSQSAKQVIFFLGTIALAVLFFKPLGYLLMSFLLMFALLRILGVKGWIFSLFLALLTSVASYFLFVQGLNIPLPKGWIGL